MYNRPLVLTGNIIVRNSNEYVIGKIVKNRNIEEKEQYIQVLDEEHIHLFEKGYLAYIFKEVPQNIDVEDINYSYHIQEYETLEDYDVVEMIHQRNIRVLYRNDSEDNVIVVTNQCNSNCIMCPDTDATRNTRENPDIRKLIEQVRCIPNDTRHITITGGEPGLLKEKLGFLLKECKRQLPNTEFLLLSNGRVFADKEFTQEIIEDLPERIRVAIPIYSEREELHEKITRAKGSFKQALTGIKRLIANKIDIEIRIVVLKQNYKYLENITKFIVEEMPEVKIVNIMALEMTGNAYRNKEAVWVDFGEMKEQLYRASITTIKAGIMTNLYNFPLCCLDERIYSIAHKSITDYKVRYKEECNKCLAKDECGGFFNSTMSVENIKVRPIT